MDKFRPGSLFAAFVALRPRLLAMAQSRLGNRATAEDLVQDTWLRLENASTATRSEGGIANTAGFVSQVTMNGIRDHFRKERRRAELDAEVQDLLWEQSDEVSAERAVMGRQTLQAVQAALDELPEKTRQIFLMNRIEGVTHRRIAEMLDMSDEAVYYHIRRALEHLAHLRDELND
ncbi:RNA polymerase sigma factor [Xinfangfangia sp. D13-10-4-6]|uniref:RNA polymerase sigma factor n=1 Tax=Pseudogemmobacter hezensis TaxID=2737662 RepID=UPI001552048E|nr:RNA polymerase sigma factor [Pseudogemmobacter hezensis]NPD16361.1 RNA polymerase sigma factor [Pseudogemmobacter hezensis]